MRLRGLIAIGVLLAVLTAGCGLFESQPTNNFRQLSVGQTKAEVLQLLGEPYKTESYNLGPAQMTYWFYLTGTVYYNVMDSDLTPVAFKDDKVVGWGDRVR